MGRIGIGSSGDGDGDGGAVEWLPSFLPPFLPSSRLPSVVIVAGCRLGSRKERIRESWCARAVAASEGVKKVDLCPFSSSSSSSSARPSVLPTSSPSSSAIWRS